MINTRFMLVVLLGCIGFGIGISSTVSAQEGVPQGVLQSAHRTPEFVLRDQYRHPLETLAFFGVEPGMTVVEIWPGKGWYTEVLVPYVDDGVFYAAHFPTGVGVDYPFFNKKRYLFSPIIFLLFFPRFTVFSSFRLIY